MPVHVIEHPLVHDALLSLRDKRTSPADFRRAATRISVLLAAEAMRDMPTADATVETPLGPAPGRRVAADVVVVPVLRAGLGMLDGYVYFFEAAGMILLVAMIGAIVLTLQHLPRVRRQDISEQVARKPSTSIEVVKARSGQGLGSNI